MATLNIGGKRVTVDDSFLSMSPDEQNAAVEEIAGSLGISPPADSAGMAINATAGLNEAIYSTLGLPVDAARGALNLGIRGVNAMTGAALPQIPEDSIGGSRSIAEGFTALGVPDPETIQPTTTGERIARGTGEGVGYTIAPEAAVGALARAGVSKLAPRLSDLAGSVFGRSSSIGSVAGNAVAGGAGGAGATVGTEAAPEQYRSLAALGGGLVGGGVGTLAAGAPALVRGGAQLAGDFAAPFTQSGRERMAGQRLREGATNPQAVIEAIDAAPRQLVPGSEPTTFQLTGDMGLGAMERGAQARRPDAFNARRGAQNEARGSALHGIQPEGAPESVAAAVRSRLQQIDQDTQAALDAATQAARERAGAVGQGMTPEASGDALRASLEAARAQAKAHERALWEAVDPDGTLALSASNAQDQAAKIRKGLPNSAKPPTGEEAEIYDVLDRYGAVAPFSELAALQSRVKAEMRAERFANGESPAYRRLTHLNAAIERDLETAVTGKVAQEADAVARGEIGAEQTAAFRISQWQDEWRSRQAEARAANTGSLGSNGGMGAASVSGARGTAGQAGVGPRTAQGNPGLSPDDLRANFDREALDRLNAARSATKERVETFDNKALAPIRRRPGTSSPYDMPASAVPQRIFFSGPKSFDAIQTFRQAVGDDQATDALTGYVVDRLRRSAVREDGTLDPNKVAAFRRSHADALRAVPELDARFADAARSSETMTEVALARKAALDNAQQGALGKLVGIDDPQDVRRVIGSLFGRQDSVRQIAQLRRAIGSDRQALEGLRKAVADHIAERFVGNTEAATTGQGQIKADQFQTFVKQNRSALRAAGFSDNELSVMEALAADLQRANRSIASVKNPGGSNTPQDLLEVARGDNGSTMLAKILIAVGAGAGGVVGGLSGGIAAAAGAVGAQTIAAMRRNGIETVNDLVADALLHPDRARMLLMKVPPRNVERHATSMAQRYNRAAFASGAGALSDTDRLGAMPLEITVTPLPREQRLPELR